jgi:HD-GYP domain-containing protein (c-di-GMP phosphodiesterase class II)
MEMLQEACEIPWIVPLVCYQVHEKPNGTGYPRHRTGPAIHVFAKILHVADAYLTLLTTSFARPPMSPYRALEYLLKQVRTGAVDRDAVRGLLQTVSLFPVGSQIVLSDGSLACVLRRNPGNYMRPIVALIRDAHGQVLEANKFLIDLAASPLGVEQALDAPAPPEPEPAMSEVADAALAAR